MIFYQASVFSPPKWRWYFLSHRIGFVDSRKQWLGIMWPVTGIKCPSLHVYNDWHCFPSLGDDLSLCFLCHAKENGAELHRKYLPTTQHRDLCVNYSCSMPVLLRNKVRDRNYDMVVISLKWKGNFMACTEDVGGKWPNHVYLIVLESPRVFYTLLIGLDL